MLSIGGGPVCHVSGCLAVVFGRPCSDTMNPMRSIISILYGLRDVFADSRVRGLLSFALMLISMATVVFWLLEDWSLLDAAFFAVATISTVGYGNVVPQTTAGIIFCMVYIILGLGVFVAAASAVAEALIRRRSASLLRGKGKRPH